MDSTIADDVRCPQLKRRRSSEGQMPSSLSTLDYAQQGRLSSSSSSPAPSSLDQSPRRDLDSHGERKQQDPSPPQQEDHQSPASMPCSRSSTPSLPSPLPLIVSALPLRTSSPLTLPESAFSTPASSHVRKKRSSSQAHLTLPTPPDSSSKADPQEVVRDVPDAANADTSMVAVWDQSTDESGVLGRLAALDVKDDDEESVGGFDDDGHGLDRSAVVVDAAADAQVDGARIPTPSPPSPPQPAPSPPSPPTDEQTPRYFGKHHGSTLPRQTFASPDPFYNPNNTTNVYINGLAPYFKAEELSRLASEFGKVLSFRVFHRFNQTKPNGGGQQQGSTYAFVLYETVEDARNCITSLRKYSDLHPSFARTQRLPGAHGAQKPSTAAGILDKSRPAYQGSPEKGSAWNGNSERTSSLLPAANVGGGSPDEEVVDLLIQGLPSTATTEIVNSLLLPYHPISTRLLPIGTEPKRDGRQIAYVRLPSLQAAKDTINRLHSRSVIGWKDGETNVKLQVVMVEPVEPHSLSPPSRHHPRAPEQSSPSFLTNDPHTMGSPYAYVNPMDYPDWTQAAPYYSTGAHPDAYAAAAAAAVTAPPYHHLQRRVVSAVVPSTSSHNARYRHDRAVSANHAVYPTSHLQQQQQQQQLHQHVPPPLVYDSLTRGGGLAIPPSSTFAHYPHNVTHHSSRMSAIGPTPPPPLVPLLDPRLMSRLQLQNATPFMPQERSSVLDVPVQRQLNGASPPSHEYMYNHPSGGAPQGAFTHLRTSPSSNPHVTSSRHHDGRELRSRHHAPPATTTLPRHPHPWQSTPPRDYHPGGQRQHQQDATDRHERVDGVGASQTRTHLQVGGRAIPLKINVPAPYGLPHPQPPQSAHQQHHTRGRRVVSGGGGGVEMEIPSPSLTFGGGGHTRNSTAGAWSASSAGAGMPATPRDGDLSNTFNVRPNPQIAEPASDQNVSSGDNPWAVAEASSGDETADPHVDPWVALASKFPAGGEGVAGVVSVEARLPRTSGPGRGRGRRRG